MTDDYVQVRVIAKQTVSYDQTLTFSRKDWEKLKSMDENKAGEEITSRLDLGDVDDSELIEDFEAVVVGNDDNPIKPLDAYFSC